MSSAREHNTSAICENIIFTLVNVIPMKSLNATNNASRIALLTHTAAEILITSCIVVCLIIPLYVPKI